MGVVLSCCLLIFFFFSTGALTHCFGLAHAFWSLCFVANTYAVIIHHNKVVFRYPIRIHLLQSVFGWLVPVVIVACCIYFASPGYKFYFMDLMTAGLTSPEMAYFSVTLPMQVTLGVSLCLLWSIVWHLRKVISCYQQSPREWFFCVGAYNFVLLYKVLTLY